MNLIYYNIMVVEYMVSTQGMSAIGAGLALGLAAIGAGNAQKEVLAAAIGAVSENPKNFTKAILFSVLPETILIFGFLVSFMIMQIK